MIRRVSLALLFLALVVLAPHGPAEPAKDAIGAVRRGVFALRQMQYADGSWGGYGIGSTSLAALALLESGVDATDPSIVKALAYVRPESVGSTHTYSISLAIMLLDRVGDTNDRPLIKALTDRLVHGQLADGGWSYQANSSEAHGLEKKYPPVVPSNPSAGRQDHIGFMNPQHGDNSNSQFAVLGTWIGRKSGSDVLDALKKADERIRKTYVPTNPGAGWGYQTVDKDANGSRTCCALLTMAAYLGANVERTLRTTPDAPSKEKGANRPDPMKDPLIREGWRYVQSEYLQEINGSQTSPDLYFMWSVERTAMAYGLIQIHGINWYRLGVIRLLFLQQPNGTWKGRYTEDVDTSFALLFLNRSNFAKDLTGLLNPKQTTELKGEGTPAEVVANETPASRLVREFLSEEPENYTKRLEEYRDAKGVEYTEAIARIIPKVDAPVQKTARECLAARLSRMTATTLRDRLKDSEVELRRAACVACAMKGDKALIGDLITVLDDADTMIVRTAGVALAKLTGENFGPAANATSEERTKAVAAWKKWWQAVGSPK